MIHRRFARLILAAPLIALGLIGATGAVGKTTVPGPVLPIILHALQVQRTDDASAPAAIRSALAWVYPSVRPKPPDPHAPKPNPGTRLHVPGSPHTYTLAQFNPHDAPDWWPRSHPPMPYVVAHGRGKFGEACGWCHGVNGEGDPQCTTLAGLPAAYIVEQLEAFRSGERVQWNMNVETRYVSPGDFSAAAAYFSKLRAGKWRWVIETATVPATHVVGAVLTPDGNGARVPIGQRIIEVPVDLHLVKLGDAGSGYIAYVPPGSIERGRRIATHGIDGGKHVGEQPCESCHGPGLRGIGPYPPLAGRSPTYMVRELIRFKLGERRNPQALPMRLEAAHLTLPVMIDAAAYAASLDP